MRTEGTPVCTVVVCTRDRPRELDRCLGALETLDSPGHTVLVVGNALTDDGSSDIARRHSARYLREPVAGLSRARNLGARACESEIVAFIDDDAVPEAGWLSHLVSEFEDPSVMAVTGRIEPLSLDTQAERLFERLGGFGSHATNRSIDKATENWFEIASFGGIGSGANMAIRRAAFDFWPGFDERLGVGTRLRGYEEHYAFFSLVDRGHRVVYTPRAIVRHPYPRSMADLHARRLDGAVAAAGFMTLLFFEQPRYRREIVRYALEWLKGKPRTWRNLTNGGPPTVIPRWRMPPAWVIGALTYLRTRRSPGTARPDR